MPRAIEYGFPFEELNRVAALESWRKEIHRPLSHVHKWWATRLGSVFRTILLASLLDDSEDTWQHFYQEHAFRDLVVLDPFMGSGTTVTEALKLGCRVVGSDINPVAYFLVREALRPVEPERLIAAFAKLEQRVQPALKPFYTSIWDGQQADLLYTFWVITIQCLDCEKASRLFADWIFSANAYPGTPLPKGRSELAVTPLLSRPLHSERDNGGRKDTYFGQINGRPPSAFSLTCMRSATARLAGPPS